MKIKSISDIPEVLFYPLKEWAQSNSTNWNIFVGILTISMVALLVIWYLLSKRLGEPDERTDGIWKKWAYVVLLAILSCEFIFPKSYFPVQFMIMKYEIALLAGSIYLYIKMKKELQ